MYSGFLQERTTIKDVRLLPFQHLASFVLLLLACMLSCSVMSDSLRHLASLSFIISQRYFPWLTPNLQIKKDLLVVHTSSCTCVSRSRGAQWNLLRCLRPTDNRQANVVTLSRRLCAV